MSAIELNVGCILVTDQTDLMETPDTHAVCVDIDKEHDGPRVWVSVNDKAVTVFVHPDEGDPSDIITIDRATKAVTREVDGDPVPSNANADLAEALQVLLVAIDCGKHESALNKSNPLCVQFARRVLLNAGAGEHAHDESETTTADTAKG